MTTASDSPLWVAKPPGRIGRAFWNPSASLLQVALAAIVLLAATPSLPAHWASITHFGKIGNNGSGELGYVTVEHCARGSLLLDWSCRGTFQVNDGMAEPYQPTADVRLANDFRWHRPGRIVGATISVGGHIGYRWGGTVEAETVAFWAGTLACAAILVVAAAAAARRRRSFLAPWTILAISVLLIGASASF